jgi:hypothetical protein
MSNPIMLYQRDIHVKNPTELHRGRFRDGWNTAISRHEYSGVHQIKRKTGQDSTAHVSMTNSFRMSF